MRHRLGAALLLLVLAGCGQSAASGPPDVRVAVGTQQVAVHPAQYCLDGKGERYSITPPILEVAPDSPITLTVPDDVAARGWSVQVFDEKLVNKLGVITVPKGKQAFTQITTSDVVPPAYYLVIIENKGGACGAFSGAWPVGFLRAGAGSPSMPTQSMPSPAPSSAG
ncbi:MAG: DUF2771 family protein [Blastococcus sp.]